MSLLTFRPVVSCDRALIPVPPARQLASLPLRRRMRFDGVGFHPDEPWLAICRLVIGRDDTPDPLVTAIALPPERLRIMANAMLAIADELDLKPAKASAK